MFHLAVSFWFQLERDSQTDRHSALLLVSPQLHANKNSKKMLSMLMYILSEKDKNKGIARIVLQLSEEATFGREAVSVDTVAAR